MIVRCDDIETVLAGGDPSDVEAAREHATVCARCAETVRVWDEISIAAKTLRREWDSPELWTRIQQRVASTGADSGHPRASQWIPLAAAAALIFVAVTGWRLFQHPRETPIAIERQLLSERALRDIERAETDYASAIDQLSALAAPAVETGDSPLRLAQKEKLLLLDAAIAQCRDAIAQNRFNARLRQELLAMYREKRLTLEEIINEPRPGS